MCFKEMRARPYIHLVLLAVDGQLRNENVFALHSEIIEYLAHVCDTSRVCCFRASLHSSAPFCFLGVNLSFPTRRRLLVLSPLTTTVSGAVDETNSPGQWTHGRELRLE
jgi:hypothetical protein